MAGLSLGMTFLHRANKTLRLLGKVYELWIKWTVKKCRRKNPNLSKTLNAPLIFQIIGDLMARSRGR
jgi:hypothetical protein